MNHQWVILGLLSACSGGSDGGGDTGAPVNFDDYVDQITAPGVTPTVALPVAGSYGYSGLIQLDLPINGPAQAFQGTFDVVLGFDAAGTPVTGTVSQLACDHAVLTGVLEIDVGQLNPNADPGIDYQFTANLGGALDESGTIYQIDGTIAGDFYGAQWAGIAGVVFGDISQGGGIDLFDGSFAGEITP